MSALTMTLLPEPVAPAMSRCGILARSTAWAVPATSRPRANVSVEPDALKSTSSRIRRRATTLKSLFGISMPTALLPGIGASIRSERAARAIARSSDSASIRLTLTSGAGWTSYWVTTGPALRPTISAGMPKLGQLLDDDLLVASVGGLVAAGVTGMAMSSSSVDRRQDVVDALACVGGESARVGDVVAGRGPGGAAATSVGRAPPAGPRGPARTCADVGSRARDRGRDGAAVVLAPDAGLAGRRRRRRPPCRWLRRPLAVAVRGRRRRRLGGGVRRRLPRPVAAERRPPTCPSQRSGRRRAGRSRLVERVEAEQPTIADDRQR